jgi:hypothetical protein
MEVHKLRRPPMKLLLKDSGLEGLKGSIQYCADCQKPRIHYRTSDGWPICGMCGYNADLIRLCAEEQLIRIGTVKDRKETSADRATK